MSEDDFFDSPSPRSLIKKEIVVRYFGAWSTIILKHTRSPIAYVDLFAGPGVYRDGTESTPIAILRLAINRPELRQRLITRFSDEKAAYIDILRERSASLDGVDQLKFWPEIFMHRVGSEHGNILGHANSMPSLYFIDPWGYAGLTLDLIGRVIEGWACECILFFNFNRVNRDISNPKVAGVIDSLFGTNRAAALRSSVKFEQGRRRRDLIIRAFREALEAVGAKHVTYFEFQSIRDCRTSHFIFFVSKRFIGAHLMKEIMASVSSEAAVVKNFRYVQEPEIPAKKPQLSFADDFGNTFTTNNLKTLLVEKCIGRSLRVWDIYASNCSDTPYTLRHVQEILLVLESEGKVTVDMPRDSRVRGNKLTLGPDRVVTFRSETGGA